MKPAKLARKYDTVTEEIGFQNLRKNRFSNFASNANDAKNDAPGSLISTKNAGILSLARTMFFLFFGSEAKFLSSKQLGLTFEIRGAERQRGEPKACFWPSRLIGVLGRRFLKEYQRRAPQQTVKEQSIFKPEKVARKSDTVTEVVGFQNLCKNRFSNFASNANDAKNDAPGALISTKNAGTLSLARTMNFWLFGSEAKFLSSKQLGLTIELSGSRRGYVQFNQVSGRLSA